MSSNLNTVWDWVKTRVGASTGIVQVEAWPYDTDIWMKSLRIMPDRMPIAHVSLKAKTTQFSSTTDADIGEPSVFVVTVLFNYKDSNQYTLVNLRDAIIQSVCNPANLIGEIQLVNLDSWEIVEKYQDVGCFKINFSITHTWSVI